MASTLPAIDSQTERRMTQIHQAIAEASVDGDSMWFMPYLTERQRRYGALFFKYRGDWKRAAKDSGYAKHAKQATIEGSEIMYAYMTALKQQMAIRLNLSADMIVTRINRIALQAEARGDLDGALKANKMLGDMIGAFPKDGPSINVNGNGVQITISAGRSADDPNVMDADYSEILEANGLSLPAVTDGN